MECIGFEAVAGTNARILILGTLPGGRSLELGHYYAATKNAFWELTSEILGFSLELDYAERCIELKNRKIALWDVLASGERSGSLDSKIVLSTCVANNFDRFFRIHRDIHLICFNGAKAESLYHRKAFGLPNGIRTIRLPSTSPAYAAMTRADKLTRWSEALASSEYGILGLP